MNEFNPDWCLHPCETIIELINRRSMRYEFFGVHMGLDWAEMQDLLAGRRDLSNADCTLLAELFNISFQFWRNLQDNYDKRKRDPEVSDLTKRIYATNTRYLM